MFMSIYVAVCIACGIFCAFIADAKGRNFIGWGVVGLATGIIGLIAICGMPKASLTVVATLKPEEEKTDKYGYGSDVIDAIIVEYPDEVPNIDEFDERLKAFKAKIYKQ